MKKNTINMKKNITLADRLLTEADTDARIRTHRGRLFAQQSANDAANIIQHLLAALQAQDLDQAIKLADQVAGKLRQAQRTARADASGPDDPESITGRLKVAAMSYLQRQQWHAGDRREFRRPSHRDLLELRAAKDVRAWGDAIYGLAQQVGERKGWGDEGVGDLHSEMMTAIAAEAGIDWDTVDNQL